MIWIGELSIIWLTKNVQWYSGVSICLQPLIRGDSTGEGCISCISSSLYSKCCSLRVGTVSPCRYNIVASWQSCNISSIFSPNDSVQLLCDSGNNTWDGCVCSRFNLLVYWSYIWRIVLTINDHIKLMYKSKCNLTYKHWTHSRKAFIYSIEKTKTFSSATHFYLEKAKWEPSHSPPPGSQ